LIPFNVPYVPEVSKQYVLEALASSHQQGDGPFTAKASKMVSDLVGGGHVLLTPSCTHALEMASMLANIGPDDEVILPSYTFTSAATAVTKFGATPVFVDVEMDTKGIDVNQVRDAISPRTKAISWVNYAGVAPDIEGLQSLANEFDLILIEDNAHGLGGSYKGKPLGSFGDFATQSFHATKNIQCGEGGALVINNPKFIERAEIIREKGTDRSRFIRGEVEKYQWLDHGSSYLLAEVLAAQLCGQLENFSKIQENRMNIWSTYFRKFVENPNSEKLFDIALFAHSKNLAHMFYLVAHSMEITTQIIQTSELAVQFHYQALHGSKKGINYPSSKNCFSNSLTLSSNLIRFPIWIGLPDDIQESAFESFLNLFAGYKL
jgi:dTDP-4-amino-4,6-dideoxygalactose transaminase